MVNAIDIVLKAYTNRNIQMRASKHYDSCPAEHPSDEDMQGPHGFTRGLRPQCGMTALLAAIFVNKLLKATKVSKDNVLFAPHSLVFMTTEGSEEFQRIIASIGQITPSIYNNRWAVAGVRTTVHLPQLDENKSVIEYVDNEEFFNMVAKIGYCWYPLFSPDHVYWTHVDWY